MMAKGKWYFALALVTAIGAVRLLLPSDYYGSSPGEWLRKKILADIDDDFGDPSAEFRSDDDAFPGAREWNDYWTHASRKGKRHGQSDDSSRIESHIRDDYVTSAVELASEATLEHIDDMKQRYESVGALPDFYARGIGWIRDRLGMVLTVVVAGDLAISENNDDANKTMHLHSGPTSVFVVDTIGKVECGGGGDSWIDFQPPLTMWVRVNGMSPGGESEIFAGTALPHNLESSTLCTWRYDFVPENAGVYSVHVKVLTFNGFVDSPSQMCPTRDVPSRNDLFDSQQIKEGDNLENLEAMNYEFVTELSAEGNYTHRRGVRGFKFYGPTDACCEACKRSRNCKMFSIPGALHFDHCELYFDRVEDDVDFLDRKDGLYLGRDRKYSYTRQEPGDFPSIRRRRKLAISSSEIKLPSWPVKMHPLQGFPPRGANSTPGEVSYFIGCGWSSLMSFESPCHYPSDDLVFVSGQKIEMVGDRLKKVTVTPNASGFSINGLRACLLDDEKLDISNGRWVRYPYPDDSVCGYNVRDSSAVGFKVFKLEYFGEQDPICWHRDDLTQIANSCGEQGCKFVINHRWMTDLKREAKWFGWWKSYSCEYLDYGDTDIQRCIDLKKISKIELRGASLKEVVESYMSQKLLKINMTTDTNNVVFLDTLKMPHLLWHKGINEHRNDLMNDFPNVTADSEQEYYFLSGFTFTSEREPHVQIDRSLQFSKMAYDILTPKGYRMINAFDVTAAFAFDTDGQADGLHIGGPPIKAIVTKFFHHLCHDVLL